MLVPKNLLIFKLYSARLPLAAASVTLPLVDQLLERYNYRKRKAQKRLSTGEHPQRNQQFENIEQIKVSYQSALNPVLSMDTKKKN